MQIKKEHKIDCSEKNASGKYEWYYEYDLYFFSEGENTFIARSYSDNLKEAHFLRKEMNGKELQLQNTDLNEKLFTEALKYLKDEEGKNEIKWLDVSNNVSGFSEIK